MHVECGRFSGSRRIHPYRRDLPGEPRIRDFAAFQPLDSVFRQKNGRVLLGAPADGFQLVHRNAGIVKTRQDQFKPAYPHFGMRPADTRVGVRQETFRRIVFRQVAPIVHRRRSNDFPKPKVIDYGFCPLGRRIYAKYQPWSTCILLAVTFHGTYCTICIRTTHVELV